MSKKIEKAVWLSFDLGIGGDYPGLYKWLDNHNAVECGDSVAFLKYPISSGKEKELFTLIKNEIGKSVNLRSGDRVYVIRREKTDSDYVVKGGFLFGKRKSTPWDGYGDAETEESEEGE